MTDAAPVLRMEKIDKRYPGVHALAQVDFDLYPGEVHVLLGENGAGKSTLMKVLSGSVARDSGRVFIEGREVGALTPETARHLGISMVYQELSLVPSLTVAENITLGSWPCRRWGGVDWKEMGRRARQSLAELGTAIDPGRRVRDLNVAEQQLTEIARVLTKSPRILLLDEPTSALSDAEREHLFAIIRRLSQRGVSIVYISHRLAEVPLIGQRVTVLRDGKLVATLPVGEAEQDTLIRMMVGRRLSEQFPKEAAAIGERLLRVRGLALPGRLADVSFDLHRGEVLGVFGLMGAGQSELGRVIFGMEPNARGEVYVDGSAVRLRGPGDAIRHHLGFLTRDRREGLVPALSVAANLTLAEVGRSHLASFLDLRREADVAAGYVSDLRIDTPSVHRRVEHLSGGNQQKVALARWLVARSTVLIFDDPTRGIDVGAKAEVYALMNRLTRRGVGIILISSDMLELLAMADRILVLRDGRVSAEFARGQTTQELLLRSAS